MAFRNWKSRSSKITSAEATVRLERKLTEQRLQDSKSPPPSPTKIPSRHTSPQNYQNFTKEESQSFEPQLYEKEQFGERLEPIPGDPL
ncbi:hypothetical protein R1flu_006330 [Riccia fluitans]|uniref:Uncharacterized protein n=1 Tax=Riccia fluitans TaxID=41844 RepID=A0ABD1YWC9_9MARC